MVTVLMKQNPLVDLLDDTFGGDAIGRIECGVVAIDTATCSLSAIPIGAGEPRMNAQLLQALPENSFEIIGIGVEWPGMSPRIYGHQDFSLGAFSKRKLIAFRFRLFILSAKRLSFFRYSTN